jgi:hypothetical protein
MAAVLRHRSKIDQIAAAAVGTHFRPAPVTAS